MAKQIVSCAAIYSMQSKVFFGSILPASPFRYEADKDQLVEIFGRILGGEAPSWSKLTLGQRNQVLDALATRWLPEHAAIDIPLLPKRLRDWRKGDAADGYERLDIPAGPLARQKRYVLMLWCLLGYEPKGLDVRVSKQFGVERFAWLADPVALATLAKDLWSRCRKAGIDPDPAEAGGTRHATAMAR
ncbi:DUF1018 domain-containing protein [Solidesulfovibrio sp.]|uniref:DUF1018 domain-containing protein n=1 Tax=Solidesulfovibrio sp. TaxID=2910990 RepID=UPI002604C935|nr:DUF1018 domain-containing protein [Solidesulfovibrio sp.]